ncbi:hypothetical protein [Streptomyces sp. NBC_01233]|uniref:hypothetical protein n=1 Tax=Streptomyces sp. NBC_01233 TaxID=2903787 RepID=UPI002E0F31A5|nr:hypothetical protein OG332_07380 [Streptomyces sp. NBC_01233]
MNTSSWRVVLNDEPGVKSPAPGAAIVLAAAPTGKGRLMETASALLPLGAIPPSRLTGTAEGSVIELVDPIEPEAVLARIRGVLQNRGPVSVYVVGQLYLDRHKSELYLGLALTTPGSLRYTSLSWRSLATELKVRSAGHTRVVVDLVAEPAAWTHIRENGLALCQGVSLYGRVLPPPRRRETRSPTYLMACAKLLNDGQELPFPTVHTAAIDLVGESDGVVLAREHCPPVALPGLRAVGRTLASRDTARSLGAGPATPEDPLPAILMAAAAGCHARAASMASACQSEALRSHGPHSAPAVQWMEVQADLARLAEDPGRSCEGWMKVAEVRLYSLRQVPEAEEVIAAVDRAHHQWLRVSDPVRTMALGATLLSLREQVPGRQPGARAAVRRRLDGFRTTATDS